MCYPSLGPSPRGYKSQMSFYKDNYIISLIIYFSVLSFLCVNQIEVLAEHNEELMKIRHVGPWSMHDIVLRTKYVTQITLCIRVLGTQTDVQGHNMVGTCSSSRLEVESGRKNCYTTLQTTSRTMKTREHFYATSSYLYKCYIANRLSLVNGESATRGRSSSVA